MKPWTIVLLVIAVILVAALVVLYFLGKKAQKKQAEQQEMMDANKQTVSMLIIDKKRMRLADAGLPAAVMEQAPKMMRRAKLPIIKAKLTTQFGSQVMSLICEEKIFDSVPVKIYVMEVKGLHGKAAVEPAKKKSRFKQALERAQEKAGAKPVK